MAAPLLKLHVDEMEEEVAVICAGFVNVIDVDDVHPFASVTT